MGRLEKRIRALEEQDANDGWDAAIHALPAEDKAVLYPFAEAWMAADEAGATHPEPTPEQAEAYRRLEALRRRALRERWPPPPWPWGGAL